MYHRWVGGQSTTSWLLIQVDLLTLAQSSLLGVTILPSPNHLKINPRLISAASSKMNDSRNRKNNERLYDVDLEPQPKCRYQDPIYFRDPSGFSAYLTAMTPCEANSRVITLEAMDRDFIGLPGAHSACPRLSSRSTTASHRQASTRGWRTTA